MSTHNLLYKLRLADHTIADPGNGATIYPEYDLAELPLVIGTGTETRTLNAPANAGQFLTITSYSVGGGTCAVTAPSAINTANNTIMTFTAANQSVTLRAVSHSTVGSRWRLVVNDGATLS